MSVRARIGRKGARILIDFPLLSVRRFTQNTAGRDLVVGDVHGCFTKLQAALDAVGFDPGAGDRLFSVGDLVDRGPESAQVLRWLGQPWFAAIKGNHEAMACEFSAGQASASLYGMNGGGWFIAMTPPERLPFLDAFEALPVAIEVETAHGLVGLVHADCPTVSWSKFTDAMRAGRGASVEFERMLDMAIWSRDRINHGDRIGVEGVSAVVVGHTPVSRVTSLGNVLFIDTGGWLQGGDSPRPLTVIDLATMSRAVAPGAKSTDLAPEML
jgi:serine/threonine protein phosphatase 1